MAKIAGRDVATSDAGILAGGAAVFVSSFLPWLGYDWYYYRSVSHVGWSSGTSAVLAILFSVAAAALVAARVFANVSVPVFQVPRLGPIGPGLLTVVLAGLGTLCVLIKIANASPYQTRFGLYIGLIGSAVVTALSVVALRASGEQVPRLGGPAPVAPQPPYGQAYGYQPAAPYVGGPGTVPPSSPPAASGYYQAPPAPAGYAPAQPPGYDPQYGPQQPYPGYQPQPSAAPPGYAQQSPSYGGYPSYGGPQPPQTPAPDQQHQPGYGQPGQQPPAGGTPYGQQPG